MPAFSAHGSSIYIDSSPDIPIGGCTSIGLPDQSKERVETTSHDSNGDREYVPGLRDGGSVTLACRLIPDDAGQVALFDNYNSNDNTLLDLVIECAPDSESNIKTYSFSAFVESTNGELPFDDAAGIGFVLRISGAVTQNSI